MDVFWDTSDAAPSTTVYDIKKHVFMKPSDHLTAPFIDLQHVTVYRGLNAVLHDVSLILRSGESTAILGPNGSGKSTLMKVFTRELYPVDSVGAYAKLFGQSHWDIWKLREHMGLISPDLHGDYMEKYSGIEVVLSGFFSSVGIPPNQVPSVWQRAKGYEVLESLGLAHLHDQAFCHMSTGERRRILLARALVNEPSMLIFDEPTTGLDIRAIRQYLKIIRTFIQEGGTVLLATHHIHEIPPEIDQIVFLKHGRVQASGSKSQLLTSSNLSQLFDMNLKVSEDNGWVQCLSNN